MDHKPIKTIFYNTKIVKFVRKSNQVVTGKVTELQMGGVRKHNLPV